MWNRVLGRRVSDSENSIDPQPQEHQQQEEQADDSEIGIELQVSTAHNDNATVGSRIDRTNGSISRNGYVSDNGYVSGLDRNGYMSGTDGNETSCGTDEQTSIDLEARDSSCDSGGSGIGDYLERDRYASDGDATVNGYNSNDDFDEDLFNSRSRSHTQHSNLSARSIRESSRSSSGFMGAFDRVRALSASTQRYSEEAEVENNDENDYDDGKEPINDDSENNNNNNNHINNNNNNATSPKNNRSNKTTLQTTNTHSLVHRRHKRVSKHKRSRQQRSSRMSVLPVSVRSTAKIVKKRLYTPRENALRAMAFRFVDNRQFKRLILLLIFTNSIILALWEPIKFKYGVESMRNYVVEVSELPFQIVFTVEMFLKMVALGFVTKEDGYFRNGWDILDFIIVGIGWGVFLTNTSSSLSGVRVVRLLRPLRTIQSMPGLRVLVLALLRSLGQLMIVFMLMTFTFLVFGIVGVALFKGNLRFQCVDLLTGSFEEFGAMQRYCGLEASARQCPEGFSCVDGFNGTLFENPSGGLVGFDNIFQAFLTLFQVITREGWSDVMYAIRDTSNAYTPAFFVFLIFFGSFFLLNLIVAVLTVNYTIQRKIEGSKDTEGKELTKVVNRANARRLKERKFNRRGGIRFALQVTEMRLMYSYEMNHMNENYNVISKEMYESMKQKHYTSYLFWKPKHALLNGDTFNGSPTAKVGTATAMTDPDDEDEVQDQLEMNESSSSSVALHLPRPGLSNSSLIPETPINESRTNMRKTSLALYVDTNRDEEEDDSAVDHTHTENPVTDYTHTGNSDVDCTNAENAVTDYTHTETPNIDYTHTENAGVDYIHSENSVVDHTALEIEANVNTSQDILYAASVRLRDGDLDGAIESAKAAANVLEALKARQAAPRGPGFSPEHSQEDHEHVLSPRPTLLSVDDRNESISDGDFGDVNSQQQEQEKQEQETRPTAIYSTLSPSLVVQFCYRTLNNPIFQATVVLMIVLNTICLSLEHFNQPVWLFAFSDITNLFFLFFFAIEMSIKLIGLGSTEYFRDQFNTFDCIVVISGVLELLLSDSTSVSSLRVFRLLRVFKLARSWTSLNRLLQHMAYTSAKVAPFAFVLLLFMYIFCVSGMHLYGGRFIIPRNLEDGSLNPEFDCTPLAGNFYISPVPLSSGDGSNNDTAQQDNVTMIEHCPTRVNYDSFLWSFVTTFQVLTGENWNEVMVMAVEETSFLSVFYFLIIVIIGTFIVLNLFLAILIDTFVENAVGESADNNHRAADTHMPVESEEQGEAQVASEAGSNVVNMNSGTGGFDEAQAETDILNVIREQQDRVDQSNLTIDEHPAFKVSTLGIFSPNNSFRRAGFTVVRHRFFNAFIFVVVLLSSLALIFDSPEIRHDLNDIEDAPITVSSRVNHMVDTPISARRDTTATADAPISASNVADDMVDIPRSDDGEDRTLLSSVEKHEFLFSSLYTGSDVDVITQKQKVEFGYLGAERDLQSKSESEEGEQSEQEKEQNEHEKRRNAAARTVAALDVIDAVVTVIFVLEAALNIIVFGFVQNDGSYLRDPGNMLDFAVVISSILSYAVVGSDLTSFRALRALRALRPLRLIKQFQGLQVVLYALGQAVIPSLQVGAMCLLFFLVLSIVAVSFFGGRLYACQQLPSECPLGVGTDWMSSPFGPTQDGAIVDLLGHCQWQRINNNTEPQCFPYDNFGVKNCPPSQQCVGQLDGRTRWRNPSYTAVIGAGTEYSFDDVLTAALTLFEVASMELWLEPMHAATDITSVGHQPIRGSNDFASLFFVLFVLFSNFFLLQLFVTVIIDVFKQATRQLSGKGFLTEYQRQWVDMQKRAAFLKPKRNQQPPTNEVRSLIFSFVESAKFQDFILAVIMLNTAVLAMEHYKMPQNLAHFIEISNVVFGVIYVLEAVLRIVALGRAYFSSYRNLFDFVVVLCVIVGFANSAMTVKGAIALGQQGASIVKAVEAVRVVRVIRLSHFVPGLRDYLRTLFLSLPSLANIGGILFLVYFVYAVIGMSLFGDILYQYPEQRFEFLSEYASFNNFGNAIVTLFRISTGESWNGLMHEMQVSQGSTATWFCVSFVLLVQFIFMNLFVAVILNNFEMEISRETIDQRSLGVYRKAWGKLTRKFGRELSKQLQANRSGRFSDDINCASFTIGEDPTSTTEEELASSRRQNEISKQTTPEQRRRRAMAIKHMVRKLVHPLYLPADYFADLFKKLTPPLGFKGSENFTDAEMLRIIRIARIPVTRTGFLHYNTTLSALIDLKHKQNNPGGRELSRQLKDMAGMLNFSDKERAFIRDMKSEQADTHTLAEYISAIHLQRHFRKWHDRGADSYTSGGQLDQTTREAAGKFRGHRSAWSSARAFNVTGESNAGGETGLSPLHSTEDSNTQLVVE